MIDVVGHGAGREFQKERGNVSNLITISDTATEAFGTFDWNEHAGKGVRLFVQGFG